MTSEPVAAPGGFDLYDLLSSSVGVASLLISIFSAWLSYQFKKEADAVNAKTTDLLIEIRSDAKAIAGGVMQEMVESNRMMRDVVTGKTNPPVTRSRRPRETRTPLGQAAVPVIEKNAFADVVPSTEPTPESGQ